MNTDANCDTSGIELPAATVARETDNELERVCRSVRATPPAKPEGE